MKKRTLFIALTVILLLAVVSAYYVYGITQSGFDTDKTVYVYVDKNKNFDMLVTQLDTVAHIRNIGNFNKVASYMELDGNLKTGRYAITPDMNVLDVVRMLKSGVQSPVKLKFNNIRLKEELAERISSQLMFSKDDLLNALNDQEKCNEFGFDTITICCMFIPNTYEFYWDVTLDRFLDRMKKEYDTFWTDKRKEQAQKIGLTPIEVSILASIVEEECYFSDEYPQVAGLYLNRLNIGQRLQADPTVKFAVGDFSIKRVLDRHLATQSLYNTYLYAGLPPGPIRIPSIKAIDGVLLPAQHNYFYMCAKEDFSGRHNFAETHAEHSRNAEKYRKALNERKIFQ